MRSKVLGKGDDRSFHLHLRNHQVWQDLTTILETIDANALVREHLEACDYKVCGYWDEQDTYYEEVLLPRTLESELVSSSIGFTEKKHFLQFKFLLNALVNVAERLERQTQKIGEIILIYNENLEFLDESWILDLDSNGEISIAKAKLGKAFK